MKRTDRTTPKPTPALSPADAPSPVEVALRKAIAAQPVQAPSRPLSRRTAAVWEW